MTSSLPKSKLTINIPSFISIKSSSLIFKSVFVTTYAPSPFRSLKGTICGLKPYNSFSLMAPLSMYENKKYPFLET